MAESLATALKLTLFQYHPEFDERIKGLIALPFYSMLGCSNEEVSWVGVGDLLILYYG